MQKKIFAIAVTVVLAAAGMTWYAFSRAGIAGKVYVANAKATKPITGASVEIWRADTLVATVPVDDDGEFAVRLAPGVYEARVHADGFLAAVFSNQKVERFKRINLEIELQQPGVTPQTVDSTSVIARRGREDIWRTWKNTLTGTPHRMTGSAVALPQVPQTNEQAAKSAQQFLVKFVDENKRNNPGLAKIDPATLHAEPVRRFKDKWFVTFSQHIKTPVAEEMLPVFGGEASVTISGKDVVQFGLDLFPEIKVRASGPLLDKAAALAKLTQYAHTVQADTAKMQLVIFAVPQIGDSTRFEYVPAYHLNLVTRSSNSDSPFEAWSYVVDAATGRLLFRENRGVVQMRASGRVKAMIIEKSPEESQPAQILLNGGQIGAAQLGFKTLGVGATFNVPGTATVRDLAVRPSNSHFTLYESGLLDLFALSLFGALPANQVYEKSLADPDVVISPAGEVTLGLDPRPNTFYHLNVVREFLVQRGIGGWLDTPLKVAFVNGYPNAFYSDTAEQLVFGSVVEPLGLRSDVIYHEFTHGLVHWLVDRKTVPGPAALPYRDEPGAINEAIADYFACAINGDAEVRLVPPEHKLANQNRRLDNQLDYNQHLQTGEKDNGYVHDNSRIFSGILWDMRLALAKKFGQQVGGDYADELILEALLTPPAPQNFADFAVNLLLADDNDGRLFNSTPQYFEIAAAFKKHGLAIPAFELSRPTVQNFTFTTNPVSPPGYLEEGREVRLNGTLIESGYDLEIASISLELNGRPIDRNAVVLQGLGQTTRLRYAVNNRQPVRSKDFGNRLSAKLRAQDLAGNETTAEITRLLRDTIKSTYEFLGCTRNQQSVKITVRVTDNGSGIDPASIEARVDGKAVSGIEREKISDEQYILRLQYPYDNQTHTVYAKFADRAGNVTAETHQLGQTCVSPCAFSGGAIFLAMALMQYRRRRDSRNDGSFDTNFSKS